MKEDEGADIALLRICGNEIMRRGKGKERFT
jgi:hypothetical protein